MKKDPKISVKILKELRDDYPNGIDQTTYAQSKKIFYENVEKFWLEKWSYLVKTRYISLDFDENPDGDGCLHYNIHINMKGLWMLNIMRKRKIWK